MDSSVNVIIEIPIGSKIKYEYHRETLVVDRVLSMAYPGNYGYVDKTLALDGDALDVVLLVAYPLHIGCRVQCRVVGMLRMEDEEGIDHKLLAVPSMDPAFDSVRDINDVPEDQVRELTRFFSEYKLSDSTRWSRVDGVVGVAEALVVLGEARQRFRS